MNGEGVDYIKLIWVDVKKIVFRNFCQHGSNEIEKFIWLLNFPFVKEMMEIGHNKYENSKISCVVEKISMKINAHN